jgi:hypothetical protein
MKHGKEDDLRLDARLGELRSALRKVHAPADGEAGLIAALAERRRSREPTVAGGARARRWRAPLAAAAGIAATAIAVLLGLGRDSAELADGGVSVTTAAPADGRTGGDASSSAQAFQPLLYSPGFSPTGSYNVVRVRIPLEALAPGQGAGGERAIEADLLVGEDGLARGIRFDSADTLFVSTVLR